MSQSISEEHEDDIPISSSETPTLPGHSNMISKKKILNRLPTEECIVLSYHNSCSEESSNPVDISNSTQSNKDKNELQSMREKSIHSASSPSHSSSKSKLLKKQHSLQPNSKGKMRKTTSIDSSLSSEESSSAEDNSGSSLVLKKRRIHTKRKKSAHAASSDQSPSRLSKRKGSLEDDNFKKRKKSMNAVSETQPAASIISPGCAKITTQQKMKHAQDSVNHKSENDSSIDKASCSRPPISHSQSTKRRPISPDDSIQKKQKITPYYSASSSSDQSSSSEDISHSEAKNKLHNIRKKRVHSKSFPGYLASNAKLSKKRHSLEENSNRKRRKTVSTDTMSSTEESSSSEDNSSSSSGLNSRKRKIHTKREKSAHKASSSSQSVSQSRSSKQIGSTQDAYNYKRKREKSSNSVSETLPSANDKLPSSSKMRSSQERDTQDLLNQIPENESSVYKASHLNLSTSPLRSIKRKPTSTNDIKHKRQKTMPIDSVSKPSGDIDSSDLSPENKSHAFSEYSKSPTICSVVRTPKQFARSYSQTKYMKSSADQTPYSPLVRYSKWKSEHRLPSYDTRELQDHFKIGFIDSHCHLDFLFKRANHRGSFQAYRRMLKEHFPVSYEGCVAVFCDPATFKQESLWGPLLKESGVWGAFGCHPHNAADYTKDVERDLLQALLHRKVKALGEIGLDYSNRNNCDKKIQHKVFKKQLKIAVCCGLPLVIHSRDSDKDCFEIMKEIVPVDYKIHLHCFTGGWDLAKMWLDGFSNLCIGITNVVTFPSATSVHTVVKNIPLERLLLETDAPYFLPRALPRSFRWSHPGMAIHVAAQICAIRQNESLKKLLKVVRKNTNRIYKI